MTEFSSNQIVNNEGVRCFQSLSFWRKLWNSRKTRNYDIWITVEESVIGIPHDVGFNTF